MATEYTKRQIGSTGAGRRPTRTTSRNKKTMHTNENVKLIARAVQATQYTLERKKKELARHVENMNLAKKYEDYDTYYSEYDAIMEIRRDIKFYEKYLRALKAAKNDTRKTGTALGYGNARFMDEKVGAYLPFYFEGTTNSLYKRRAAQHKKLTRTRKDTSSRWD